LFNTNLKNLSNYLSEVLEHKKHFNIDDELQKYNIEKREAVLRNILENNPFGFEDLSMETLHKNKSTLFFRGHNNAPFYEKEIFYDAISIIPQEVNGISSAFEILTKFQHFGTSTRLLDITTNPLAALMIQDS